jgi:YgiT-type zinc finger domain-containing protein
MNRIRKSGVLILNQKLNNMECVICKNGATKDGKTTVTLEKEGSVIIIKDVPASICQNCGQYYLDEEISKQILNIAQETFNKGIEVEIMHLKAG